MADHSRQLERKDPSLVITITERVSSIVKLHYGFQKRRLSVAQKISQQSGFNLSDQIAGVLKEPEVESCNHRLG